MIDPEEIPVFEGYAAWAPVYDDDGNPLIAIEGPLIRSWFGPIAGRRVLDLGCGTGRHTLALAEAGASVVALDGSAAMMDRARVRLCDDSVGWIRHRLPDPLPFSSSSFDLVVLGLVAEHLEDLSSVMLEARRVTKLGGRCLLSTLHPDRTAGGQRARFIDPETGIRRQIVTIHRSVEEYLAIARDSGWLIEEERSLIVSRELAERLPRAIPYVGQSLGWAARWRAPSF